MKGTKHLRRCLEISHAPTGLAPLRPHHPTTPPHTTASLLTPHTAPRLKMWDLGGVDSNPMMAYKYDIAEPLIRYSKFYVKRIL
jgi:hypothetical protein